MLWHPAIPSQSIHHSATGPKVMHAKTQLFHKSNSQRLRSQDEATTMAGSNGAESPGMLENVDGKLGNFMILPSGYD